MRIHVDTSSPRHGWSGQDGVTHRDWGCLQPRHRRDHGRSVCSSCPHLQQPVDKIEMVWEGDPKKMKDLEQMPCRKIPYGMKGLPEKSKGGLIAVCKYLHRRWFLIADSSLI